MQTSFDSRTKKKKKKKKEKRYRQQRQCSNRRHRPRRNRPRADRRSMRSAANQTKRNNIDAQVTTSIGSPTQTSPFVSERQQQSDLECGERTWRCDERRQRERPVATSSRSHSMHAVLLRVLQSCRTCHQTMFTEHNKKKEKITPVDTQCRQRVACAQQADLTSSFDKVNDDTHMRRRVRGIKSLRYRALRRRSMRSRRDQVRAVRAHDTRARRSSRPTALCAPTPIATTNTTKAKKKRITSTTKMRPTTSLCSINATNSKRET
jgi:hypothetical protein